MKLIEIEVTIAVLGLNAIQSLFVRLGRASNAHATRLYERLRQNRYIPAYLEVVAY